LAATPPRWYRRDAPKCRGAGRGPSFFHRGRFMAFPIKRRTIVRGVAAVPFALLSARYQIKRALAEDDVTPADITQLTVLAAGLDSREADQPENADVFIIAR